MSKFAEQLNRISDNINKTWDQELIPILEKYIEIPNKSPAFDPDWESHGYMQQAMDLIYQWVKTVPIKGMKHKVLQLPTRTPLLFIEIPGDSDETVLLYGHMDKQPEMTGWDADKGPWKSVIKENKLYGRGGADDGYAVFASLTAILEMQKHNIPHARCVIIVEGCEESGSYDLPFYLDELEAEIGIPNLVICLDSTCGNYEQMWGATSLRGVINGNLDIEVLHEGIHSGIGSGIAPSVEMVLRQLLDRIEDKHTGEILIDEFKTDIPALRIEQAKTAAAMLGDELIQSYPFHGNTTAVTQDNVELILNRSWRAQLSITGVEGIPALQDAGNVTLPKATFKLSFRTPPTLKSSKLVPALKKILEQDPPFNATVRFNATERGTGWHSPELAPWLEQANDLASNQFFGKPAAYLGEGGYIPFMPMLGKKFPDAQFLITGVLGPHSNAHGPNEFLHIPTVKKITGCVASVLASHYDYFEKNNPLNYNSKKLGLLWALLVLLFIDSLNYFLVIPVFQRLFSPDYPLLPAAMSQHSRELVFGLAVLLSPLGFIISSAIAGHLSDRFGRKKTLIGCLSASVIGYFIPIIGIAKNQLWLILLGRFLAGASTSSQPIAQAAVADITTGKQKAIYLAMVGFAMTFAMTIGPSLGALLSDHSANHWLNVTVPYWFGLSLSVFNILLLIIFFKETYQQDITPKANHYKKLLAALNKPIILRLLAVFFLVEFSWTLYYQVLFIYMPKVYGYSTNKTSYFTAYLGVWMSIGLVFMYPFFLRFLKLSSFLTLSLLLTTIGFLGVSLIPFIWSQWTFTILVSIFTGTAYASLLAALSNQTDKDHQGLVLGATSTLLGITWTVTAVIDSATISYSNQLPFYLATISLAVALFLYLTHTKKLKANEL